MPIHNGLFNHTDRNRTQVRHLTPDLLFLFLGGELAAGLPGHFPVINTLGRTHRRYVA
jgi:hypothetical protein